MSFLHSIAPVPADLGLPDSFSRWRAVQLTAVDDAYSAFVNDIATVAQMIPCGGGKSLSNVTVAVLLRALVGDGMRAVYLTHSLALQAQLLSEFAECGAVVIMGRGNYECALGVSKSVTCEDGAHLGCKAHKDGACEYVNALNAAKDSSLPIANYAYWIAVNKYGEGLGVVDLLICDEASLAVDTICNAMAIEVSKTDLGRVALKPPEHATALNMGSMDTWREWAKNALETVGKRVKESAGRLRADNASGSADTRAVKDHKALADLEGRLETLAATTGEWIPDVAYTDTPNGGHVVSGWRFDPLWPAEYAEETLFCGVRWRLLTSATMTKKTCELLGVR